MIDPPVEAHRIDDPDEDDDDEVTDWVPGKESADILVADGVHRVFGGTDLAGVQEGKKFLVLERFAGGEPFQRHRNRLLEIFGFDVDVSWLRLAEIQREIPVREDIDRSD